MPDAFEPGHIPGGGKLVDMLPPVGVRQRWLPDFRTGDRDAIAGFIIRAAYKEKAAMKKERQTFQHGWLVRKSRSKGPDVWVLCWREGEADKSRTLGRTQQLRTKAEAQRSASKFIAEINNSVGIKTFGQLARRYLQEAVPEPPRAVMHRLFEYAMRWVRTIYLLDAKQYHAILSCLAPHVPASSPCSP